MAPRPDGGTTPGGYHRLVTLATFKDLCIDASDASALGAFWSAALGLDLHRKSNGDACLTGPTRAHTIWIKHVVEPKSVKHRIHVDVHGSSIDSLLEIGASVLDAESFQQFEVEQVFRADSWAMLRAGARWMLSALTAGRAASAPKSLFDNLPLHELLTRSVDWGAVHANVEAGHLHAIALCATAYGGGRSNTWHISAPWAITCSSPTRCTSTTARSTSWSTTT